MTVRLVFLCLIGNASLAFADYGVSVSTDANWSVPFNSTANVFISSHSDPENLYGTYAWFRRPDGSSDIIWGTYRDYINWSDYSGQDSITFNQPGWWVIGQDASFTDDNGDNRVIDNSGQIWIYVSPPPNQAPTISWNSLPGGTFYRGQSINAQAHASDGDGNLANAYVESSVNAGAWTPFSYVGGGDGRDSYSADIAGAAWSAGSPGTTIQFRALAVDAVGANSGYILSPVFTVGNRPPSTSLTINGGSGSTTITFGQSAVFASTMTDPDGNLYAHHIYWDQGSGMRWTNLFQDWNYPRNAAGWTAVTGDANAIGGYSHVLTATFTPVKAGYFGFLVGGYDDQNVWSNWTSAGMERGLTVLKATPVVGNWSNRNLSGPYTIQSADFAATLTNPNGGTVSAPSGTVIYSIAGSTTLTAGSLLQPGTYSIRAAYSGDANYNSNYRDTTWTIAYPTPTISSGGTMAALEGQLASYQISASPNPISYSYSWIGAAPAGTTQFNIGTGLFQLTPNVGSAGAWLFNVNATNSTGLGANRTVSLTIYSRPIITSSLALVTRQGSSVSYQIAASGQPTSFSASGLPSGMSVNPVTGLITGSISAPGAYAVQVSAANIMASGSATVTITVTPTFSLSVGAAPASGGTVSGAGTFDAGTVANFSATARPGYRFANWGGTDASSVATPGSPASSAVMTANRSIVANFVPLATLTLGATTGGTAAGGGTFDAGSVVPIGASPIPGNVFTGWSGSAVANPNSATTTVALSSSLTVTANFAPYSGTSSATVLFPDAAPSGITGMTATTSSRSANIANSGNSVLTITALTTTGDFSPSVSLPLAIAPGASAAVPITFSPTALGTRTGLFTAISNDTPNSILTFVLQGEGADSSAVPTVTISAAPAGYAGTPFTVQSTATLSSGSLTNHSIEAMSPAGSWTIYPGTASGRTNSRTLAITFGTLGTWTLRGGASKDNGVTWTYSAPINVIVTDGLTRVNVNAVAVPSPGTEIWYTPSPVVTKQFTIQRRNP